MGNTVYSINKGINRPLEFRGLRAQYIWYLGGGLVAVLVVYAVLYICGLNAYLCVALCVGLGGFVFVKVYKMNKTYGQHGLARKAAGRRVPKVLRSKSRRWLTYRKG